VRQSAGVSRTLRSRGATRWSIALAIAVVAAQSGTLQAVDPAKPFHRYVRDAWSVESGLPQLSAMALAQTADGYIWVGTQRGLARFDGINFRVYGSKDYSELPSDYINALLTDSRGRLWIGTIAGVARIDGDGVLRQVAIRHGDRGKPIALDVTGFAQSPSGLVLAASPAGLLRESAAGDLQADPAAAQSVHAVASVGDAIWLGVDGGVLRVAANGSSARFPLPAVHGGVPVRKLGWRDGGLYAGTEAGLFHQVEDRLAPVRLAGIPTDAPVSMLHADRTGALWIGLRDRLLRLRRDGSAETIDDPALNHVEAALEDAEQNLWLGSRRSGVHRVWDGWAERFARLDGLDRPIVWSAAARRAGGMWIGTSSGLRRFDGLRFETPPGYAALESATINALLDEGDRLLIGTNLGLKEARGGRVGPVPGGEALESLRIFGLARDRAGALVLVTSGGAYRQRGGAIERIQSVPLEASLNMRSLAVAGDGRIFVAALGGVFEVAERLEPVPIEGEGRGFNGITADVDGRLVVGDIAGHLWVQQGGLLKRYGTAQGLPENFPTALHIDRRGVLWVAGLLGLYRVPYADFDALAEGRIAAVRAEMVLSITGRVPGAQHSLCCNGGGAQSALAFGDDLWLTTPDGIVRIPTAEQISNPVIPKVHVERVHHSDAWHPVGADLDELPLGARDVAYEFTVTSFRDPKSARLRYMLEGYDRDWRDLPDVKYRRANYTNLPPGDYTFKVRGANDRGSWSEQEAVHRFRVPARFVETRGSIALLVLVLASFGYGAYLWRVAALRQDRHRLQAAVERRTEELAEANRQLLEASETDPLTRLKNRRFIYDQLPADIANLQRRLLGDDAEAGAIGFLVVDADHFKRINDEHGHDVGDDVLRRIASTLRTAVRPGDYVVRWGGEEFLIVLRELQSGDLALVAENLRRAIAEAGFAAESGARLAITASIGGVEYPLVRSAPKALSWQKHVELADLALYAAKKAGRNTWALKVAAPEAAELLSPRLSNGPTVDIVSAGVAETRHKEVGRGERI